MAEEDLTQISMGSMKVGISGLKAAIEEVRELAGRPDEEIAEALLARVRARNYIPMGAVEQYKWALLREFKRALGERVEEERGGGLSVKILGPGCASCRNLTSLVMAVLSELQLPADVEHVTDLREIAAHGVMSPPALIINGEVRAVGQMPGREALKKLLLDNAPPKP